MNSKHDDNTSVPNNQTDEKITPEQFKDPKLMNIMVDDTVIMKNTKKKN